MITAKVGLITLINNIRCNVASAILGNLGFVYKYGTYDIAGGKHYWESQSQLYPDNKELWGDLAGKPLRYYTK